MEKIEESIFLKNYVKELFSQIESILHEPLKEEQENTLKSLVMKSLKNDVDILVKDYHRRTDTSHTLLSLLDWMEEEKPITTGQGALFRPSSQYHSHIVDFIEYLGVQRAVAKSKMFDAMKKHGKNSVEYRTYNNQQLTYKLLANSTYGVFGETGFHFYETTVAPSITYTGRLVISMMLYGFECYLQGNAWVETREEMLQYCAASLSNESNLSLEGATREGFEGMARTTLEKVSHGIPVEERNGHVDAVLSILGNVDPDLGVAALGYRGNPYGFLDLLDVKEDLRRIILDESINLANGTQRDIDALPDDLKEIMEETARHLHAAVSPVWIPPDLTLRADRITRRGVIHTDTDSTFLSLQPWIDWIWDGWNEGNTSGRRFKALNIIIYFLGYFSRKWMDMLATNLNVPDDKKSILEFKSELVISRMFLTSGKKHYGSWITHQEGVPVGGGGYADFKGLAMKKTNVPESTGMRLQDLVEKHVLSGEVDRPRILGEIEAFISEIAKNVSKGSTKYASPATVNDPKHYKNPWSITSVRGRHAWNTAFPEMEMRIGDRIGLYRLKVGTNANMLQNVFLRENGEEYMEAFQGANAIYNRWWNAFFAENVPMEIRKNGMNWLAIPKDMDTLPEWIIPLIDTSSIIQSNLSAILPVLSVLGLGTISSTQYGSMPSNIVEV